MIIYDSALRDKVIRLHLEVGKSLRSLTQEFSLGSGIAKYWVDKYRKDCSDSKEGIQKLEDDSTQKDLLKRIENLEKKIVSKKRWQPSLPKKSISSLSIH